MVALRQMPSPDNSLATTKLTNDTKRNWASPWFGDRHFRNRICENTIALRTPMGNWMGIIFPITIAVCCLLTDSVQGTDEFDATHRMR